MCHKAKQDKTATDNQWVSTHLKSEPDRRPRKDGPGGEDGDQKKINEKA